MYMSLHQFDRMPANLTSFRRIRLDTPELLIF
jgi:hypothetical protein